MKSLYIIGNGFDCYAHDMKTKYTDFKEYLINRFPKYKSSLDGILETTTMPDGGEVYDMDEVTGSIIRTIDDCPNTGWGNLEECLGSEFISYIAYENEWAYQVVDFELDDNEIFRSVYNNEDVSNSIVGAYQILMKLFQDWVFNELAYIDYRKIQKLKKKPSFRRSIFLSFNYTSTLEEIYKVSKADICHIHGDASDKTSQIYFGHGDDEEFKGFIQYIGIDDAFNMLKKSLRKNTRQAIEGNNEFFEKLSHINKIYSYGFSFSDVDMVYIEEICKYIEPQKVRWYFNTYDWENNKDNIDKIRKLGFRVKHCRRW